MPKFMNIEDMFQILDKTYDYIQKKRIKSFSIILHGGEPFLWPLQNFERIFNYINLRNNSKYEIKFSIQTNGYKIPWNLLKLLYEQKVPIGISIDGPKELHDSFRLTHNGRPTYNTVLNNINEICNRGYSQILGGFLTVVNPLINPQKYFEWLQLLPIKKVDVLWPIEFNYQNTPWGFFGITESKYKNEPIYGKWFFNLFRIWYQNDDPNIYIRFFYETLRVICGDHLHHSDNIINDQLNMFVVNTNGAIEYHDYFRALKNGNNATRFNIIDNTLFEIEEDNLFRKFFLLKDFNPIKCNDCENRVICGGGFLPGRMEESIEDFAKNKSILCYDHLYFFNSVKSIIAETIE